jgi:hypothetical protein
MARYALLLLLGAGMASAARAQDRVLDRGTLLVSRAGVAIGREEFTVFQGRRTAPQGYTIAVRSFYPPNRPEPTISPVVELGPDSQPTGVQLIDAAGPQRRVFLQIDDRRVTLRTMTPAGESVRQFPGTEHLLIADDSALSLYAILPALSGPVGQIWPREQRRDVIQLSDRGVDSVDVRGSVRQLRHVVLGTGDGARHLWYDASGRLVKVEVPAARLTAVRDPGQ